MGHLWRLEDRLSSLERRLETGENRLDAAEKRIDIMHPELEALKAAEAQLEIVVAAVVADHAQLIERLNKAVVDTSWDEVTQVQLAMGAQVAKLNAIVTPAPMPEPEPVPEPAPMPEPAPVQTVEPVVEPEPKGKPEPKA